MLPHLATLTQVRTLALGIKLFRCKFNDEEVGRTFSHQPGQFGFLSAFGVGESPFGVTSTTRRLPGEVEFALAKVGTVTAALHDLQPGATVGVRGPYGNSFPLDEIKGKNIVIIGGGIGMAPLRPVIQTIADRPTSVR
jgi:sulfhydrogenase subunit gamma (sulfur reductase)